MDQVNTKATFRDNDIFNREFYAYYLMRLIDSHSHARGACSIAINAPWGIGKSTFLRMWINELDLSNPNFHCAEEMDPPYKPLFPGRCTIPIYYNAWENDFYDEPLVAILSVMIECLKKQKSLILRIKCI